MRALYRFTHPVFQWGFWFLGIGYLYYLNADAITRGQRALAPDELVVILLFTGIIPALISRAHKYVPTPVPRVPSRKAAKVAKAKEIQFSPVKVAVTGTLGTASEKAMRAKLSPQLRQLMNG